MSKFTSFLKKAGQVLVAGAQIAEEGIPALAPFVNLITPASKQAAVQTIESKVESEISLLSQSVMTAETTANALAQSGTAISGAQKAQIAAVGFTQVLMNSEAMAGKKIGDPVAAQAAAAKMAGAMADWWNAVNSDNLPDPPSAPVANPAAPVQPSS